MFDNDLVNSIEQAAEKAFTELFAKHPGTYYYCTLVTTGEALAPVVSAWSHEALASEILRAGASRDLIKWSCVDSPYYAFGQDYFAAVRKKFESRVVTPDYPEDEWFSEYDIRLQSMVEAMRRLDLTGLFGQGEYRDNLLLLVEVVPPDETNTDRAKQLNRGRSLDVWIAEAAE